MRKAEASGTASAQRAYQNLIANGSSSSAPATSVPRNTEQIQNTLKRQSNNSRKIPRCTIRYPRTGLRHTFHPPHYYLSVILYRPEMMDISRSCVLSASTSDIPIQQLSYDTTFNLGDFYPSVLLFRVTYFEYCSTVPIAYLIHESKLADTHKDFFRHVASTIPELQKTTNTVIVTDGETAIRQAIEKHLPAVKSFLCWNHLLLVSYCLRQRYLYR